MADVHSKETRSYNMSQIKGRNTKPEILVRKFLFNSGFRYRLHSKDLPGKPDIILPKFKTVIFVNGCFWHQHSNCKNSVLPKSNQEYWIEKLNKNVLRDKETHKNLKKLGWNLIVIWECNLKSPKREKTLKTLINKIHL